MLQQVQRRGLVGADHQPAGRVVAQLRQRDLQLPLKVLEAPRVLQHDLAGIGQQDLLARAVEQLLAQFVLETLHRQRHRGLCPQQLLGRPRKALLGGNRLENLQRVEFHMPNVSLAGINQHYSINTSYRTTA